jgi:tetratricopeptide (TPR) repeat protein
MSAKSRKSRKAVSHIKRNVKLRGTRKHTQEEKTAFSKLFRRKQKTGRYQTHISITGWRLWMFRFAAVTIIPIILFLLFEVTLCVVGYGFPTNMFIKCKVNDTDSYCNNIKYSWSFFPPNIARMANPFVFSANKTKNTYRIFILGASAAAGVPKEAFCFGRILQAMLQQQYPQTDFEVINTAMPAINSHVVLDIAKDCMRHQSDLFIVYLGNNEVVGPYGAGTVFTPLNTSLSLIRFGIALKTTKLGQLLTNLPKLVNDSDIPEVWLGMGMFLEEQVRADDPRMETVYQHFKRNLQDIRHLACKSGAPIIFCTVPCNLKDSPPFASLHRPDLTDVEKKSWDKHYQLGIQYEQDGNFSEAVEQYIKAAEFDNRYADLQFRLGRCYWAMGDYDTSKERYIQARELDTLRFRADNRINDIIHSVASGKAKEGVYLLDAVNLFERNSPHNITGEELFYEHVHMNFNGNYLLAAVIFRQVQEILPEWVAHKNVNGQKLLAEGECARYLAYTDWERYKIAEDVLNSYIKQAPFTNQLYHNQQVDRMERQIQALKTALSPEVIKKISAQCVWAIEQNPSDWWLHWNFGEFLENMNSYNEASRQFRLVLNYVPSRYEAWAKLGLLSGLQGDIDAAINYNLKALDINPLFPDARFNLGLAYQFQGNFNKAIEQYSDAIRLKPDHAQAYNNLGNVLYKQGKIAQAVETYRNGLKRVPNDWDLHYNLGLMLEAQGQRDEAVKELRIALQIDPNSARALQALAAIEKNQ